MLIDVSRLIWRRWTGRLPTGIDRVCLAYLRHFGPKSRAVIQRAGRQIVLDVDASRRLFALLLDEPGTVFRSQFIGLLPRVAAGSFRGPNWTGSLYLNIGHTGLEQPGLGQWIRRYRLKAVYLVHDLIPITHPEYCREGEGERHRRRMSLVLETAAGVIGNSRYTIDRLSEFAQDNGLPLPPMLAATLGLDLGADMTSPPCAPSAPYFVMLGTIEARKNHLLMLQLWGRLAATYDGSIPQLRIIGQRGWEAEQACDLLDRARFPVDRVIEIGRCTDEELVTHLKGARALLFPSLEEGFGLPLIETLAQGTPAIASDLPVFREIAGDVPDYLDPLDGLGWRDAVLDYSNDTSQRRAAQLQRLRAYSPPTWASHFSAVEDWLPSLTMP